VTTNEKIAAMAESLLEPGAPVLESDALDRSKLDFSTDSLRTIDRYLEALHRLNEANLPEGETRAPSAGFFENPDFHQAMALLAAYVGETMRRKRPAEVNWLSFEELAIAHPKGAQLIADGSPIVKDFNLVKTGGKVVWPGNKVVKRVINGDEDSVWFFAGLFDDAPEQKAAR
jgi:hypothetical protein